MLRAALCRRVFLEQLESITSAAHGYFVISVDEAVSAERNQATDGRRRRLTAVDGIFLLELAIARAVDSAVPDAGSTLTLFAACPGLLDYRICPADERRTLLETMRTAVSNHIRIQLEELTQALEKSELADYTYLNFREDFMAVQTALSVLTPIRSDQTTEEFNHNRVCAIAYLSEASEGRHDIYDAMGEAQIVLADGDSARSARIAVGDARGFARFYPDIAAAAVRRSTAGSG
jgi:hypothetical protein